MMHRVPLTPDDFPDRVLLRGFEGGAVYTAERGGEFYVIQDEGGMAWMLDEEDRADLEFVKVFEFATLSERDAYIHERGWDIPTRRGGG